MVTKKRNKHIPLPPEEVYRLQHRPVHITFGEGQKARMIEALTHHLENNDYPPNSRGGQQLDACALVRRTLRETEGDTFTFPIIRLSYARSALAGPKDWNAPLSAENNKYEMYKDIDDLVRDSLWKVGP